MLTDKIKVAIMTILSFLCVLIMSGPALVHAITWNTLDLGGTDSKGSYSYDDNQARKGSSAVGRGSVSRKSEGSRSKASPHGSGKKYPLHFPGDMSHKTYSHGKPGDSYSPKKSEGSGPKSYSHGKSGHGSGQHKSGGSYSKSYGHGKSGHRGRRGYSKGHGHASSPFTHVLRFREKLGLTAEQIDKIKNLRFEYKKVKIQARADHQIAHMELDRQVHSGTIDEAKIRAAGSKIIAAKTKKITAMVEAKIKLLNLLTEEQRKKMVAMHSAY
jgi:Spy/CpxP family protein refolding chaperone